MELSVGQVNEKKEEISERIHEHFNLQHIKYSYIPLFSCILKQFKKW